MLIPRSSTKVLLAAFLLLQAPVSSMGQNTCTKVFQAHSSDSQLNQDSELAASGTHFIETLMEKYFKIPRENQGIITHYTGSLAFFLNKELVKKEGLRSARYLGIMDELNTALSSRWAFKGTTYSGAVLRPETFQDLDLKVGKEFQFNYFVSTSTSRIVANEFIEKGVKANSKSRIPVLFVFDGYTGRNITAISTFIGEEEVLFRSDAKFKVEKISTLNLDWSSHFGKGRKGYVVKLREITEPEAQLSNHASYDPDIIPSKYIEAQRFIDPQDWEKANTANPQEPGSFYGENTFENWKKADQYLKSLPFTTHLSWNLIETIHKISSNHSSIELRKNIDFNNGPRYSKSELEIFLRNPFFNMDLNTLHKIDDLHYEADVRYVDSGKVLENVNLAIKESEKLIKSAKTDADYVWAVAKLEYALLSIRPFAENNEPTIRLIGDWILRNQFINVPIRPTKFTPTLTVEEYYNLTIRGINDYTSKVSKPKH